MFSRNLTFSSTGSFSDKIERLSAALGDCDAVIVGAGAGLSTSAGYSYAGERFDRYFYDFRDTYGIRDMYTGGFYPFPNEETFWAWWSRHIWVNRYAPIPTDLYDRLRELLEGKDYFVLTTNVDHCFQRAGFDKKRLFYTQGDYGLLQSVRPTVMRTYDNEEQMRAMLLAQGFAIGPDGALTIPQGVKLKMEIPSELIPVCPDDGGPMTTNLRSDDSFVEDEGWHLAAGRYADFLRRHEGLKNLYLELGVGGNTPGIIKYPFWQMTAQNPKAVYACVNYGEAVCPKTIEDRAILLDSDIAAVVRALSEKV